MHNSQQKEACVRVAVSLSTALECQDIAQAAGMDLSLSKAVNAVLVNTIKQRKANYAPAEEPVCKCQNIKLLN